MSFPALASTVLPSAYFVVESLRLMSKYTSGIEQIQLQQVDRKLVARLNTIAADRHREREKEKDTAEEKAEVESEKH